MLASIFAAHSSSIQVPQSAKDHIGQFVMLEGVVSDVSLSKTGAVFLNFGEKPPNEIFTVYIPSTLARGTKLEGWKAYTGKKVQEDGRVKLHDGKPEIELQQLNLIKLAK